MRTRSIAILALVLALFFGGCGAGQQTESSAVTGSHEPTEAELRASAAAEELNGVFLLGSSTPDFYGGAKRDGETCVVYVTDLSDTVEETVRNASSNPELLRFEECRYSAAELRAFYDAVAALPEAEGLRFHVSVPDNCLVVNLDEADPDLEAALEALDPGDALEIRIGGTVETDR